MIKKKDYFVFDDAVPKYYQKQIYDHVLRSVEFPYAYRPDVNAHTDSFQPAFSHQFYFGRLNVESEHWFTFLPLAYLAADKINLNIKEIIQARSFLLYPIHEDFLLPHDQPHIDIEEEHTVIIYYANDSEGDTILFDDDKQTELARISPKQGRVLIFNGLQYHCSTHPQTKMRCVINYNVR